MSPQLTIPNDLPVLLLLRLVEFSDPLGVESRYTACSVFKAYETPHSYALESPVVQSPILLPKIISREFLDLVTELGFLQWF